MVLTVYSHNNVRIYCKFILSVASKIQIPTLTIYKIHMRDKVNLR